MAMQESHDKQETPPATGAPALSPAGRARRRLATAGVAASGVLLTVASQPGMACDICRSPSGFLSGALQSQHLRNTVCSGRSPVYWKGNDNWPNRIAKTTKFSTIFSCTSANRSYKDATLQQMLAGQSFDNHKIGQYLAAAYLNVQAKLSSFQNLLMLQTIWQEYQTKGYYAPIAGKKWYAYDIAFYLSGTMS
ncbi:hypothetical protein ACFOLJ_23205 [Rugamonas sp. CCM 8940]|uniref:hypothetical protein n=1 Tax=Rugamonas sp. CCM 8940 TaxID=2765359 RepID=UPI0018F7B784|nr:hypothetical protein [Rugamonas sp. CCM 8940]MBJ7312440.1 hypothetical protein [Rugamonas sp. CCM 8940]